MYHIPWTFVLRSHQGSASFAYILMAAQNWDLICVIEDALFGTIVHIVWYWLSFNA